VHRNTAFVDEATYLSAGHYLLHGISHQTVNMHFAAYLSGAPFLYPPLGALADSVGGLAGARYLSMAFMLTATVLASATARRLWGRPAGWLAAGTFVTTQGVQFLGSFATYDAMALMLVALAAWMAVRFSTCARVSSAVYAAAAVLVLANATKYASTLYDPVVVCLVFCVTAVNHGARNACRFALTFAAFLVVGLAMLLAVAPKDYLAGISSTTVARAPSNTPVHVVLHLTWNWVGIVGCASAAAAVIAAGLLARGRLRWATAGTLGVCAFAVWLAPLNQARIHTATSLSKHVTFGAWFGALAAGWFLSGVLTPAGRHVRRASTLRYWLAAISSGVALVALIPVGVAGTEQAAAEETKWPSSVSVIEALRPLVPHTTGLLLMDDAEVGRYYLGREAPVPKWVDTFYFAYTPVGARARLTGTAAYRAAVDDGAFSVIALDYGEQMSVDRAVDTAVHASRKYAWVGDFTSHDEFGPVTYVVWKRKA
jgi:hypothetical protein